MLHLFQAGAHQTLTPAPHRFHTNRASRVISALSALETGQFCSASFASRVNVASSKLGTLARSVKAERLMRNPAPSGSRLTAASVLSSVGVNPAPCKRKANAIVKQPACAAAMSSSGFVPRSFSKRVRNEYGVLARTPESVERSPLPARPVPRHTAFALRIMEASVLQLLYWSIQHRGRRAREGSRAASVSVSPRVAFTG